MRGSPASAPRPSGEARSDTSRQPTAGRPATRWEPPAFELIPLDCEITAYAPAGDEPLF